LIASIVTIVLLFLQNFFFIDPFTNLAFDKYDTGKGKIVATEYEGGNFGDSLVNNFRHTYLYDLVDEMLAQSEFDAGTCVVIPYERDYFPFYAYAKYDRTEEKRIFSTQSDEENVVSIRHKFLHEILEGDTKAPQKGIMYFLPYIDSDEQEYIEKAELLYDVGERKEISNWGGSLVYYELQRK